MKTLIERFDQLFEREKLKNEAAREIVDNNPRLREPISSTIVVVMCALFFILFPFVLMLPASAHFKDSLFPAISSYISIITTVLIFLINQKWIIPNFLKKNRILMFLLSGVVIIIFALLRFFLLRFIEYSMFGSSFFPNPPPEPRESHPILGLVIFFAINAFVFIVNLTVYVYNIQVRYIVSNAMNQRDRLRSELALMKVQVSPHFLFNTLNNILALVDIEPNLAKKSIVNLSSVFRTILYETQNDVITLAKEVDILRSYTTLENIKYNGKFGLQIEEDIQDESVEIAPLLLLPLIENVFKHGVNPKAESSAKITLRERNNVVELWTENQAIKRPATSDNPYHGIGIANMKRRLSYLYPNKYEYSANEESGVYKAYLKIDLNREGEE